MYLYNSATHKKEEFVPNHPRLYVHKDHQGRGVATALCSALEAACPVKNFTTHASLTAMVRLTRGSPT